MKRRILKHVHSDLQDVSDHDDDDDAGELLSQAGVGGGARVQRSQPRGRRDHGVQGEEQGGGVQVGEGQHSHRCIPRQVRVGEQ